MIGPNNWIMVKCATEGCTSPEWLMHWPCDGSEEFIRSGPHTCGACRWKAHDDRALANPVRHYPVTLPETVFQDDESEIGNIVSELKEIARKKVGKN
jgi:hypothetical protein